MTGSEPEISGLQIVACPHPFDATRIEIRIAAGPTLSEILAIAQPDEAMRRFAHVSIGDQLIYREHYHRIRPKEGMRITIRILPGKKAAGGGKGGGGKNPLNIILSVVMIAASIAIPALIGPSLFGMGSLGTMIAKGVIVAGINLVGGMAMNALAPPSKPKLAALAAPTSGGAAGVDRDSPTLSLTGARNDVRPFAALPVVLGEHWQTPALGAPVYTEIDGADQYLRMVVIWGIGPLNVVNVKVGDTLVDVFDGVLREFRRGFQPDQIHYRGIWNNTGGFPPGALFGDMWQIGVDCTILGKVLRAGETITYCAVPDDPGHPSAWDVNTERPFTLYPYDVVERPEQIEILQDWTIRTTAENTDQIGVDVVFYRGLVRFGDTGNKLSVAVAIEVEYALVGGGAWGVVGAVVTEAAQTSAVRRTITFNVPRGQYDIRIRRQDPPSIDTRVINDAMVSAIRSTRYEAPFDHNGGVGRPALCAEVIRIKATEQLQGAVDNLNGICQSIAPDWTGAEWRTRITNNPASLFRLVFEGAGNMVPASTSEINLTDLQHWHGFCSANQMTFNHIVDYHSTVDQIATDIAASARASLTRRDNQYTVVLDEPVAVPVQVFTPRNSWGFRSEILYPEIPHAYRVRYIDAHTGAGLEMPVYDDGYGEHNSTIYESMQATGITRADLIHKYARYHLAVARLRRETVTFMADFEGLVCTRGDLIRFSHDVPLWGLTTGRVGDTVIEGPHIIGVRVDEIVRMEEGKSYSIRFRRGTGVAMEQIASVVFRPGDSSTIMISAIPLDTAGSRTVSAGDLFWFGETGREHRDLRVHGVTYPSPDFESQIICVEDNPAIYMADQAAIPPYDPGLNDGSSVRHPRILSMRSDGTVVFRAPDGTYDNRILITYAGVGGTMAPAIFGVEAQYRNILSDTWQMTPPTILGLGEISLMNVDGGARYEIALRFVRRDGTRGIWSPSEYHTVAANDGVPPDIAYFVVTRMADGTRRFEWRMVLEPAEVRAGGGYRIRYQTGTGFDWAAAQSISTAGLIPSSPWEMNDLPAGVYTFGIKAVTAAGAESTAARTMTINLGDPRMRDVLLLQHEHLLGWPGGKTDCFSWGPDPQFLMAGPAAGSLWNAQGIWSSMGTWDSLPRVSSMSYTTAIFDPAAGGDVTFTPLIDVDADNLTSVEMRTRTAAQTSDMTGASWEPVAQVSRKAFIQFRVTAGGPKIRRMTITLDGKVVVEDIEDIDTLTTTAAWFQRLGVGHFRVANRKNISVITGASIRSVQSSGTGWTWQLVSKTAAVAGNTAQAAEFKLYDGTILSDAIVDVELKGPV